MRRLGSLILMTVMLLAVVVGSFYTYVCLRSDSGAVPSALLAGITSISPYHVSYAGPESQESCLAAYRYVKQHTAVQWIEDSADSRYVSSKNTVYLTRDAFAQDTVEAVHEYGHALDRYLHGEENGYFSRREAFADAYAADCAAMQKDFQAQELFCGEAYRNLAVSDMLFAVFRDDSEMTQVLFASYNATGVSYWYHETEYLSRQENRQTEVFADIFAVLLSDDEEAKRFLKCWFPASTAQLIQAVEEKKWNLTL